VTCPKKHRLDVTDVAALIQDWAMWADVDELAYITEQITGCRVNIVYDEKRDEHIFEMTETDNYCGLFSRYEHLERKET